MKKIHFDGSRRDNERPNIVKDNFTGESYEFVCYNGNYNIKLKRDDGTFFHPSTKDSSRFSFFKESSNNKIDTHNHTPKFDYSSSTKQTKNIYENLSFFISNMPQEMCNYSYNNNKTQSNINSYNTHNNYYNESKSNNKTEEYLNEIKILKNKFNELKEENSILKNNNQILKEKRMRSKNNLKNKISQLLYEFENSFNKTINEKESKLFEMNYKIQELEVELEKEKEKYNLKEKELILKEKYEKLYIQKIIELNNLNQQLSQDYNALENIFQNEKNKNFELNFKLKHKEENEKSNEDLIKNLLNDVEELNKKLNHYKEKEKSDNNLKNNNNNSNNNNNNKNCNSNNNSSSNWKSKPNNNYSNNNSNNSNKYSFVYSSIKNDNNNDNKNNLQQFNDIKIEEWKKKLRSELDREGLEKERLEKLRRERLEKEKQERDKQEKERLERIRKERIRLEKLEKEQKERLEKEKKERLEKEQKQKTENERKILIEKVLKCTTAYKVFDLNRNDPLMVKEERLKIYYKKWLILLHPDKSGDSYDERCSEAFLRIKEAREIIQGTCQNPVYFK